MKTRTFVFVVTQTCQLSCKYCYLVGKNSYGVMNIVIARKAIDYILSEKKFHDCEDVIIDFIGGEPLLEIDLINDIVEYFKSELNRLDHIWKEHYVIKITTNGLLYANAKTQNFISKHKKHLSISISIDGNQQKNDMNRIYRNGKGSYNDIIDNVCLWRTQFPDEGTKMVISHADIPYVKDSLVHLVQLGIKSIDVNPCIEDVWHVDDGNKLEKQLILFADFIIQNDLWRNLNISCFHQNIGSSILENCVQSPCGGMTLAIDFKGDLFTCMRFAQYSLRSRKERIVGNVNKGVDWNEMRPFQLLYTDIVSSNKCIDCEVAGGCKWCPAENYDSSLSGTIFQRTVAACEIHKAEVRAKNYYWNRLYYSKFMQNNKINNSI